MKTYHAMHVPGVTRDEVLDALDKFFFAKYFTRRNTEAAEGAHWTLAVSDELDGWVSVYDEGQNFRRANRVARALSAYLHRPVLWMGLFDDLDFYYQLFSDGEAIDAYDSDASIFDEEEGFTDEPEGTGWLPADFSGLNKDRNIAGLGDPSAFLSVFPFGDLPLAGRMQALLSRGRAYHGPGQPDFDELSWVDEGVAAFAGLLGIPAERATTGYDALAEMPEPPRWFKPFEYRKLAQPAARRAKSKGKGAEK